MRKLFTATLLVTFLLSLGIQQQATAQKQQGIENPDIRIGVDGLACPFCAYGIEKKLKKIDVIEKLYTNIENGTIDLTLKEETTLSEKAIKKAISDAGFEVRSIEYVNEAVKPGTASQSTK
jgi:mercuric ion binding protein